MRVKEDYMQNGQLKPAYNLQIATNAQFVLGYGIFQNPTDTRTLMPFVDQLKQYETLGSTIVADAGYGSESNYRQLEDEYPATTVLIPYGTMLKETSKKWQTDERKVMNWNYCAEDDYYVDPRNVRFNFKRLSKRTDKYGFVRDFKVYEAEAQTENLEDIAAALTPKGYTRKITVNPAFEYHKAKIRSEFSKEENQAIYAQRKIDVESVFGRLKAYFGFTRFSVRGIERVKREVGIALMAMNMKKLATK
ncbi:transposase [Periweissella cryptocerci]|uniref:transposase n=1 Tax=Periweissella cryptocerci TaxID=2506420 RepID=UPI001FA990F0|nr:transposase [Periweissella cryptocerci]